jgi:hypothetical protein
MLHEAPWAPRTCIMHSHGERDYGSRSVSYARRDYVVACATTAHSLPSTSPSPTDAGQWRISLLIGRQWSWNVLDPASKRMENTRLVQLWTQENHHYIHTEVNANGINFLDLDFANRFQSSAFSFVHSVDFFFRFARSNRTGAGRVTAVSVHGARFSASRGCSVDGYSMSSSSISWIQDGSEVLPTLRRSQALLSTRTTCSSS